VAEEKLPGILELTPMNPSFNDNPHVLLDRLRSECPVHRDTMAGVFLVSRHADVRGTLSDTTMWRGPTRAEEAAVFTRGQLDRREDGVTVPEDEFNANILMMDEPDHMRIREPFAKALYKRVAKSKPLVQRVVDEWLDAIGDAKTFDVMAEFAVRVPIDVIARILGVDESRLAEFRAWSEGAILSLNPFRSPEDSKRMIVAVNALSHYMRAMMAERAKAPKDDLISDMMALKAQGAELSEGEISNNLQGLLIGGNLTTTDLIGNGIWLLLTHADQLAALKANPALINSTVEEILRYEPPVDITGRIAPRDMDLGGCPVKQSQSLIFALRGANRDPAAFHEPHRFDICEEHQALRMKRRSDLAGGGVGVRV